MQITFQYLKLKMRLAHLSILFQILFKFLQMSTKTVPTVPSVFNTSINNSIIFIDAFSYIFNSNQLFESLVTNRRFTTTVYPIFLLDTIEKIVVILIMQRLEQKVIFKQTIGFTQVFLYGIKLIIKTTWKFIILEMFLCLIY